VNILSEKMQRAKGVFDDMLPPMTFAQAQAELSAGKCVRRRGWQSHVLGIAFLKGNLPDKFDGKPFVGMAVERTPTARTRFSATR